MVRPTSKTELLSAATQQYAKLQSLISQLTEEELNTPFDFSKDEKRKEAHWKRDKNLRDVLIHLYEWQQLLLNWVYGELHVAFWQKHQQTSLEEATKMLHQSQKNVLVLAENFTDEELFSKGIYKWVGGSTLGSYFISSTSSHYDWAMKKLKAHRKDCKSQ